MPNLELEKCFRKLVAPDERIHEDVWAPLLRARNTGDFGSQNFALTWNPITNPVSLSVNHAHEFDQYLIFTGSDGTGMDDLGGIVELTLSKDGLNKEVFTITEATCVYIPSSIYHSPVNFKRINDPKKPIIFQMLSFITPDDYKMIFADPAAEEESKRQAEKVAMLEKELKEKKA